MSEEHDRTGGCLCGAVRYRAGGGPEPRALHCHCENCRRLSGNFVAAMRVSSEALAIEDNDGRFRWYDLPYARYGFCQGCGSTLFYRAAERPDITSVMVGTLDVAADLEVAAVWFADEARPSSVPAGDTPRFAGNG